MLFLNAKNSVISQLYSLLVLNFIQPIPLPKSVNIRNEYGLFLFVNRI